MADADDRHRTTDGGMAVARAMKAAGVTTIFALHGGHLDAAFKGFLDEGITLVDTRHEACAGHAAEGWARVTGGLGVCMITAGPGFTNALTSMANARLDGVPVLFMAGAPPLREEALNVLQGGVDQIAMARPVVKHAIRITDPHRIADQLANAITIALGGRPGPVFVELPIDVLAKSAELPEVMPKPVAPVPTAPMPEQVDTVVALLKKARRPVAILGGLARYQATQAQVAAFLDTLGIPVVHSSRALGLVDPAHPAYAHDPSAIAVAGAEGQSPDLILMLGSRFGLFLGGRTRTFFPEDAPIVQVHADVAEFGLIHEPAVATTAQVGAFMDAVAAAWDEPAARFHSWRDVLRTAASTVGSEFVEETASGKINPYFATRAAVEGSPEGTSFVLEGGEAGLWAGYHARVAHPGGVLTFGQLGALGIGFGFALGAAYARPGKPVVQITGDGAVGFHLQEFETMVRQRLPIVTVVMNNSCWGQSIHGQQILYGPNYNCLSVLGDIKYHEIAQGFGLYGERVTTLEDIGPAIARAFASGKPGCIDVVIDADLVLPMTSAMLGEAGPDEVMVPYYENFKL
ncbi:thiamine pyrophosphate-binding protein [Sphingomonas sp.]|jgi:acetolactate synthase-1/2/3 large subunit|uniref:thiamine pyrophosphate-binding protein n=1 Tax=Sphingomonas sp. TaxID=28214 RepID=UPI0035C82604